MNYVRKINKALLIILISMASELLAQIPSVVGNISLNDFNISGFDEKQQQWILSGTQTNATGPTVQMDDFRLCILLNQQNMDNNAKEGEPFFTADSTGHVQVLLSSQSCTLNTITREIKSNDAITITIGSNLILTGNGYDIDLPHRTILLRSTVSVKMKVKANLVKNKYPKGTSK